MKTHLPEHTAAGQQLKGKNWVQHYPHSFTLCNLFAFLTHEKVFMTLYLSVLETYPGMSAF